MRSWLPRSPQNVMEATPRRSRRCVADSRRRPAFRSKLESLEKRVLLAADLAASEAVNIANPVPGQVVDYTISVQNVGTTSATSSTLTDTLPAGMTLLGASTDTGSVTASGGTVNGDLGTIAAGATATVHVFGVVDTGTSGLLANNVSVSSPDDTNSANNAATANVTAGAAAATAADLAVSASGLPATLTVGQQGTLLLTVTNNSSTNAASNVQLMGTLPSGVSILSASASGTGTLTQNGGLLTANLGTLAPGASATVSIVELAIAPGSLNETAFATTDSGDSNTADNSATASATVGAAGSGAADLQVTKTGPATGTVGENVTYTISVSNLSTTSTAAAAQLTDVLPAGLTLVSATSSVGSVSSSGGVISANLGDLAPGASETLTVIALPNAAGAISNTVSASTSSGDSNMSNNFSTVNTTISAAGSGAADLGVTKTAAASGTVGSNLTYTITVTNLSGSNTATASTLTDALPSGLTFVSATSSVGSVSSSGGIVTANLGDLAPGASATITLVGLPNAAGSLTNTAEVSTSAGDSNSANNVAAASTTISAAGSGAADLGVTKTAAASGTVGSNLTYTITVTNLSGSNTATASTLTDALPSGLTFVSATSSVGSVSSSGGVVTANLGDLAPGASATITLVGLPNAAGNLTNTAVVSTSSGDSNGANNVAAANTTISAAGSGAADLAVTKTAPATGTVGSNLTYTITVTNLSGSNTATAAVLTDPLPAGLTFVSASSSVGTASNSGGVITANLGDLAPGASATITVVATPSAASSLTNTAMVSTSAGDVNLSNNTASATTTVNTAAQANVSITKIASPDPDTVGQNLTYTITVQNSGGADAAGTSVSDVLPAGVTFVSSSSSAGSVSNSGGTVTANLGTLAAGASDTITIVVTPNAAGTLVNTASVTTTSPNSSQNTTATVSSTVNAAGGGGGGGGGGSNCYLAGQAGDGTDATFVANLYHELLGRDADSGGQAFWVNYLDHNGQANHLNNPRRLNVIDSFIASQEYQEHLVSCMFEHFLNRAPDAGGLQFFVAQLAHGVDERIVLSEIVGSQEYFIINGNTNTGFVDALYRDLLGRGADPGGEAYWANLAAQAGPSHDNLVREMLGSPEAEHDLLLNASSSGLSQVTGGGWENSYFQGHVSNAGAANDVFYQKLQANTPWDDVIEDMLESNHYYDSSKSN